MSNRNGDRVTAGMRRKLSQIYEKISVEKQRERIVWAVNRNTIAAGRGGTLQDRGWLRCVHLMLEKLFVGARWSGCFFEGQIRTIRLGRGCQGREHRAPSLARISWQ